MNKTHIEIIAIILFVFVGTYFVYGFLSRYPAFWEAQSLWNTLLLGGLTILSVSYFRQGWLIRHRHSDANISSLVPSVVFVVQCIIFIKGAIFHDPALMFGALILNSGVTFCLYQITQAKIHALRHGRR